MEYINFIDRKRTLVEIKRFSIMKLLTITSVTRILFLVIFSLFHIGCYYDNIETKYNQAECDLTNISWTSDVKPLIDQFCVACHRGSSPAAGLLLEDYQDVKASVLQGEFSIRINKPLSDPSKMPPNAIIDSCSIEKMNIWIANGALDN